MEDAIDFAKENGAILAECVKHPEMNFHWGWFQGKGTVLPRPKTFEKDAFLHALYRVRAGGYTDLLSLYRRSRELGCDTDIFITDEWHTVNARPLSKTIEDCDKAGLGRPRAVVIVHIDCDSYWGRHQDLQNVFTKMGIPFTVLKPEALKESALVSQAVKTALLGANATIDEIMETPLLELPKWWYTVK
jgi:hypothetical protein